MKTKSFVIVALSSATLVSAAQTEQVKSPYPYQQPPTSFKETPRTIMDEEIAKNIHPIMSGNWLSNGYPNVTFDVNNGIVNLRGIVDTKTDKTKIEEAVRKMEGVKAVNSEITVGLPTKSPSTHNQTPTFKDSATTDKDNLINTSLREKIRKWSPRGYETIIIATSNGAVVIRGNVERVEDIQKISNDAKSVDGVKSVTNQISIKKL